MASETLTVHLVRCGEPRTSVWCDDCLKPSVVEQDYALAHGMKVMKQGTLQACRDCGRTSG